MNNRVEVNIPDLLKLTERQSINSIAKQYGYSYATVYRRVEELKINKANQDKIEMEEIKKVRPLKKSSIQVINSATFRYINVDIMDNTDIQEPLFFLAENEMIEANHYEFIFRKSELGFEKEMSIDYETFERIEKIESLTICNRVKEYSNGVYFTDDIDIFYAELEEGVDLEQPIGLSFNRKIGEITQLLEKSYKGALDRKGNIYRVGLIFKVSSDLMSRLRDCFEITHKLYNPENKDYPIIKNLK